MVFLPFLFLLDQAPKTVWVEVLGGVAAVLTIIFAYLQVSKKSNSEVAIAKIANDGAADKQELERALAKLKEIDRELADETERRRRAEALLKETESKLRDELNLRAITILKLKESVKATKAMLRIALKQMERQYENAPEKGELLSTFKEIHNYLDQDSLR